MSLWASLKEWFGWFEATPPVPQPSSYAMRISDAGLSIIKRFEGLRLVAYRDGGEVWTCGWGHTRDVGRLTTCTKEQAEAWLREDVASAEMAVNKLVEMPLKQNQYDALVSWVFNVGIGAFGKSTLLKRLNQGEMELAADEILRWNKDNGKVVPGLANRRKEERELFLA